MLRTVFIRSDQEAELEGTKAILYSENKTKMDNLRPPNLAIQRF